MTEFESHYGHIKELLETEHSKAQTMLIVEYIGVDSHRFEALMSLFLDDDWWMNQRASWPLPYIVSKSPELIYPYLNQLINSLENPTHNAVVRNTVKILQDIEIPEDYQGKIVDICMNLLANPNEPVANRMFSMNVVYNISLKWPDLQNELKILIESQMNHGSPGFKSRGRKIIALIEKNSRFNP